MNGFYASMLFLGIILVIVSLILIFLDKKKAFSFVKSFDDKKEELSVIIADAEQMIDELNRFSDYIVNQMDLKNEELNRNLKAAEEKVLALSERAEGLNVSATGLRAGTAELSAGTAKSRSDTAEYRADTADITRAVPSAELCDGLAYSEQAQEGFLNVPLAVNSGPAGTVNVMAAAYGRVGGPGMDAAVKRKDKVIQFSNRYTEVLRLSKEGMNSLDIAKKLDMGKGEVELIIGLRS